MDFWSPDAGRNELQCRTSGARAWGKTFAATRSKCLLVFNCGVSDSAGIEGCDKSWFPVSCREARSRFGRVVNSHGRPTLPDHDLTLTGDIDEDLICAPCEGLFNLDRVEMLTTGALGARLLDPYLMAKIDQRAQQGPKVVDGPLGFTQVLPGGFYHVGEHFRVQLGFAHQLENQKFMKTQVQQAGEIARNGA